MTWYQTLIGSLRTDVVETKIALNGAVFSIYSSVFSDQIEISQEKMLIPCCPIGVGKLILIITLVKLPFTQHVR